MSTTAPGRAIGAPLSRIEGPQKVTGTAPYAYEHHVDNPLYLYPLHSDIARGRVEQIDAGAAEGLPGMIAVISHHNAPRLADTGDRELAILQSDEVAFRGQYIGAVVAETFEIARHAANLVEVSYDEEPHDAAFRPDRDDLYTPERLNAGFPTYTEEGDVEGAFSSAAVKLDETYTTPLEHNNPMEPHTTVAVWEAGELTLYESTQGAHTVRRTIARVFGWTETGFGSWRPTSAAGSGPRSAARQHDPGCYGRAGSRGPPHKVRADPPADVPCVGYRTPTVQRIRLGADEEGHLTATSHDVIEQTCEDKGVRRADRLRDPHDVATENRRTTHRLVPLDVSVPSWMRAPGEALGCTPWKLLWTRWR